MAEIVPQVALAAYPRADDRLTAEIQGGLAWRRGDAPMLWRLNFDASTCFKIKLDHVHFQSLGAWDYPEPWISSSLSGTPRL